MPFGLAPFVGIDSLVNRRLRQRQDSGLLPPPEPTISEMPDVPGGLGAAETAYQQAHPQQPSFLSRLGQRLTSQEGIAALQAGLQAGQGAGGLEALLGGFTGGLGARYGVRHAAEAEAAKAAEEAKKYGLEKRRVVADEQRANSDFLRATAEHPNTKQTEADKLAAELAFLQSINATPEEIKAHFLARGQAGSGRGGVGGGRLTDREALAQSLLASGQAANIDIARIMAARITSQPQFVGSIERVVSDPNDISGFRRVRVNVSRRFNPQTGAYDIIDAFGNPITAQEQAQIRTDVAGFGDVNAPPPPPPPLTDQQKPAGGLHDFIKRQGVVSSHAPVRLQGR